MTEKKICTMPYRAGSEKESNWPPPLELRGNRGRYHMRDGKCIPGDPPKKKHESAFVLPDEIPETESMATSEGKKFTSRRKLFEHYKQHGYECTGGDHLGQKAPPIDDKKMEIELRETAERAYYDIKYDRVPFTEHEKEICRKEENAFQAYKKRQ